MDIVEALRKYQCPTNKGCNTLVEYCQCNIMDDAADELDTLRHDKQFAIDVCKALKEDNERLKQDLDRMSSLAIDNAKDTGRAIKYRGALHAIGYGPPHEGEPLDLLNKFVDLARYALEENEE